MLIVWFFGSFANYTLQIDHKVTTYFAYMQIKSEKIAILHKKCQFFRLLNQNKSRSRLGFTLTLPLFTSYFTLIYLFL